MGGQADPGRPGFWDQLAASPAFNMGMGILANNQGHYGAWGPALGKGVQQGVLTTQQAREAEMMAEYRRAQAAAQAQEAKLKAQQEAAWQAAYPTGGGQGAAAGSVSPAQHLSVLEQLAIQSRNSKLLADVQDLKLKLMQADPSYAYQQQFAQESAKSMFAPYQEVKGAKGEPVYLRPGERLGGGGDELPRGASPADITSSTKTAEMWAGRYAEAMKDKDAAAGRLQTLQAMRSMLPGIETGKLSPSVTQVQAWAESLGVPIDAQKLGAKQAFEALSNQITLQARNPGGGAGMPGAMSDADREFLKNSVPRLSASKEGNLRMLDISEKLAQRSIDAAELLQRYREKFGRIDEGAEAALRQFAQRNPLFGR
ncbi:MAG: hypothetical protein NHG36_15250 [Chromatiaceae bacterium]|nr:hypothetical protein [Candidatus Thioaporhodococcus sediminis]